MGRTAQVVSAGVLGPLLGLWITTLSLTAGVAVIVASIAWRAALK